MKKKKKNLIFFGKIQAILRGKLPKIANSKKKLAQESFQHSMNALIKTNTIQDTFLHVLSIISTSASPSKFLAISTGTSKGALRVIA